MTAAPVSEPTPHPQLLRELHHDLEQRGLLAPSRFWVGKLLFWVPLFLTSYFAMMLLPLGPARLLLAPVAGVALLTMGFAGHDAGHNALSRTHWVNDFWGQVAMTLLCGMSFGSWRARHNLHHAKCQDVDGDPDMHFGVLFSVYPNSANWQTPLGRFFLRIQKWAFWPLSSLYWITLGLRRDPRPVPASAGHQDRSLLDPAPLAALAGGPRIGVRLVAGAARLPGHVVHVIADDGVGVHPEPHRHAPPGRRTQAELPRAAGDDQPEHQQSRARSISTTAG